MRRWLYAFVSVLMIAGPAYRVDAGTTQTSWLFDVNGNTEGWTAYNISAQIVSGSIWTVNPDNDPQLVSPLLSRNPSSVNYLKIGTRNNGGDTNGEVFFSESGYPFSPSRKASFTNPNNDRYNWITVRLDNIPNWNSVSNLDYIRIDPVWNGVPVNGSDNVSIDYIFLRYDNTKPLQPTITSVSPSGWTNGSITISFQSNDPADVNPVGPDVYGSGIGRFMYRVDPQADQIKWPDSFDDRTGLASASVTYAPGQLPQGVSSFHVYCFDKVDNVSNDNQTTLYFDSAPPNNPTTVSSSSHTPWSWSNNRTVGVSWSGASDGSGSGVGGYSWEWTTSSTTVPDAVQDGTGTVTSSPALSDGAWYFHVRTRDNVGNWAGDATHYGPFLIDGTAPSNPTTVSSSSHTPSSWSNDRTVDVSWSGASDGGGSGISGYSWEWTTSSTTVPDAVQDGTGTVTSSPILSDGAWYYHVRARDNVGNWAGGAAHYGPFLIDGTTPSNPASVTSSSHEISVCACDPTVDVCWSGASDVGGSGISGYSWVWTTSSATIPDATQDGTGTCATSPSLADGSSWYFHVRSRDSAGNWTAGATHFGPICVDMSGPSGIANLTSTSHTVGVWSKNNAVDLSWNPATDNVSGIAGYSYCWSSVSSTIPDNVVETAGTSVNDLAVEDGASLYFHVCAVNGVGVAGEAAHLGPLRIDHTPPSVTLISPDGEEIWFCGSFHAIGWNATDNLGLDSISIYYSVNGGRTFPYAIATAASNDSLYLWKVPYTPSDSCVVKVVAYDHSLNTAEDVSDAFFSIQSPGTGITFASVSAVGNSGYVRLSWQMAAEVSVSSFVIKCSESPDQGFMTLGLSISKESRLAFSCTDYSVQSGKTYWYEIVLATPSGEESYGPIEVYVEGVPVAYMAHQSYPNPFNPLCTIRFDIPKAGRVSLQVFDVNGSVVRTLVDGWREPGLYSEIWDGKRDDGALLPSGVYFYSIKAGDFVATRKMVLLK